MSVIYCPACDEPLPETANYCAICGEPLMSAKLQPAHFMASDEEDTLLEVAPQLSVALVDHPTMPMLPFFSLVDRNGSNSSYRESEKQPVAVPGESYSRTGHTTAPLVHDQWAYVGKTEGSDEHDPTLQVTWHKDVEHTNTPPRGALAYPPRPSQPTPTRLKSLSRRRLPTNIFFWASLVVTVVLVLSGAFGIFASLGRGLEPTPKGNISLQVTPNTVALGATMTLRGMNFTPNGHIGLTRDASIPITDTGGATVIQADSDGSFADTVTVLQDWGGGSHTINTEDAVSHKTASFPITVTGQNDSLRPAHLKLSTTLLDLGTGDQATNSARELLLTNVGSGQINWQASSTQPWLQFTPTSGTFAGDTENKIIVAVDRTNLKPGEHTAQINFSSNAGDDTLSVNMQVTPLQVDNQAVLQLTPEVLSFAAADGGASPASQTIKVNNPGTQPLHWKATTDLPWFTITPNSGVIAPSGSQSVTIGVNTSPLLPGTYMATVNFSSQGSDVVKDSPQNIYMSVTITPHCTLLASPTTLSFTGAYLQPAPDAKILNLGGTQSCTTPIAWSVTSNASWLTINATNGKTPSNPQVAINVAGLGPGTYDSALIFNSSAGTQTVPVTLTLGQATTPLMSVRQTNVTFNGTTGQLGAASIAGQTVAFTNTGGGNLHWRAAVSTASGGAWLGVTPTAGVLATGQSASLSVTTRMLSMLVPGTYNGTITITGTDDAGRIATGTPQTIPISFVVKAACSTTAASLNTTPAYLNFTGDGTQTVTITPRGGCGQSLRWTAQVTGASAGGTWLSVTPGSGSTTLGNAGTVSVGVVTTNLAAGTYRGRVTITAIDSVTHATVATQNVAVRLTVQGQQSRGGDTPTLTASPASLTINVTTNTASQPISIGNSGGAPLHWTAHLDQGAPSFVSLSSSQGTNLAGGASTTIDVNVKATGAPGGKSYTTNVVVSATDPATGQAVAGSPLTIPVTINITAPTMQLSATNLSFSSAADGKPSSQGIVVNNNGGDGLTWHVGTSSASWLTVSPTSGSDAAQASSTITFTADPSGLSAGSHNATVTITSSGGQAFRVRVTLTITSSPSPSPSPGTTPTPPPKRTTTVTPSPDPKVRPDPSPVATATPTPDPTSTAAPSMQVSTTSLSYTVKAGSGSFAKSITVSNSGGGTLRWRAGASSASWLAVSPTGGSDAAQASSTITFTADPSGLSAGSHNATVTITSSAGSAITVTVRLTISGQPSPSPSPGASPTSVAPIKVTPTPTAQPDPTPTLIPVKKRTATPVPKPDPTATAAPTPTPTAAPTATPKPKPKPKLLVTPTPKPIVIATPKPKLVVTPNAALTPTPKPKRKSAAAPILTPTATPLP